MYRPAIVTFVDILGFRSVVHHKDASEIKEIITKVQNFAGSSDEKFAKEIGDEDRFNWTRCVFFSDSIVRIRYFDGEYSDGSLFHEIIDLLHAQAELSDLGVFIRGGLTIGDVYYEGQTIFGPAMMAAYDLESNFANYPRIIIDPKVFDLLENDNRLRAEHHSLKDEKEYIEKLVRSSEDGLHYIDYLGAVRYEMDDPDEFPRFLGSVKRHILSEVKSNTERRSVLQKYWWLAKYLNSVAEEHEDCAKDESVVISRNEMPEISVF